MKQKKFKKKLTLNKETIVKLDAKDMNFAKAGITLPTVEWPRWTCCGWCTLIECTTLTIKPYCP